MKKLRMAVIVMLCLVMFAGNTLYAPAAETESETTSKTEYPSTDDLSEEEKELLPYYNNGWTICEHGSAKYKLYYLGKEIKDISFELNGVARYRGSSYTVTDNCQLFTSCTNYDSADTSYSCIVRYDLNTDECKELNSITYLKNTSDIGDYSMMVSQGNNVYIIFKKYVSSNNYTFNVLKYDEKEDTFKDVSTITNVPSQMSWLVYNTENKMWTSTGYRENNGVSETVFIDFDLENGKYVIRDDYDFKAGDLGKDTKFALYMSQKGIRYYWGIFSVLNDKTGKYDKYYKLVKCDILTEKETEILVNTSTLGSFYALTHKGIILKKNDIPYYHYYIVNDSKEDYRELLILSAFSNDLWNYYATRNAKPLYPAESPEVTKVNSTYTDRITINWQAVNGATGYNVYVNNKKVNTDAITDNKFTITGLKEGNAYEIYMTSISEAGESEKSVVTKVTTGSILLGDINNDKKVNIIDAMQVFHYVSGRNKTVNVNTTNSDINGDGKVNVIDAMKIFHYASGRNSEY